MTDPFFFITHAHCNNKIIIIMVNNNEGLQQHGFIIWKRVILLGLARFLPPFCYEWRACRAELIIIATACIKIIVSMILVLFTMTCLPQNVYSEQPRPRSISSGFDNEMLLSAVERRERERKKKAASAFKHKATHSNKAHTYHLHKRFTPRFNKKKTKIQWS